MDKPHILQIVAKTPLWGFDLAREIAIAIDLAGCEVTTIFLNGEYAEHTEKAYPGRTLFPEYNHKSTTWRLSAFKDILQLCQKHHFDTVISHHYKPSSIMALIDRIHPVKQLYMLNHNPGNLRRKARTYVIKHLFSCRWHFLGVSDWVRRDFLEHAPFMNPDQMSVLYNCLDIEAVRQHQLSRTEARKRLKLTDTDFIFGNIHRLDPSKGHDYLIRAFASIASKMPNAKLVIIGGGERKTLLEGIAKDNNVGDRVYLAGMIPDASSYTPAFDAFVSPSLHEGFGLGLLEGMAAALPTITSTGGASPEVVGDTGLQFPPGDETVLATQLLSCYQLSPDERALLGKQSLQRLRDKFSKDVYHHNVQALLNVQ